MASASAVRKVSALHKVKSDLNLKATFCSPNITSQALNTARSKPWAQLDMFPPHNYILLFNEMNVFYYPLSLKLLYFIMFVNLIPLLVLT